MQCVVDGAHDLRSEYVVRVTGTVRPRPEGTSNPNLPTGEVELGPCKVEVLNVAEPPPFPIDERTEVDETIRLRHRYVDLRSERMQRNLRVRATVNSAIRRSMERQGFTEVETPMLIASTPEGARDFVVPSRLSPGSFYALPQSPQLFKQLCMVGGVDRYYQIARCLRDEDLRADRQFEFMQLDAEASFVGQDEVLAFISDAVAEATEAVTGERPADIPPMTWHEARERFGSDKPDVRFGMELVELTAAVRRDRLQRLQGAVRQGHPRARRGIDDPQPARRAHRPGQAVGGQGPGVDARGRRRGRAVGSRLAGGQVPERGRAGRPGRRARGRARATCCCSWPTSCPTVCHVLGLLRLELGRPPVTEGGFNFLWVVDFPLFESLDDDGRPVPAHHPFTMPHPDDHALLDQAEGEELLDVRAQAYDLVLNGWELGSGSVRIHRSDIQSRVFELLGISAEEAQLKFGFLLDAFRYGAPPHAGFAFGIDRLVALLAGEENIREVIAFPKTQSGTDPLTSAPTPIAPAQLTELGLRLLPKST